MKRTLTIPSELSEITLKQHQRLLEIDEPTNEQLVSIFCNISTEEVLQLPNNVYDKAVQTLDKLTEKFNDKHELQMRFELNGTQYGMIPNLDEISYGENKDLTKYLGDWKTMHLAMAVLYRPVEDRLGKTYSIEKYNGTREHREVMQHMPLEVVLGAQLFFYRLTEDLLKAIPNYLERALNNNLKEDQQTQEESTKLTGEAMMKCIASLRETLGDLTK